MKEVAKTLVDMASGEAMAMILNKATPWPMLKELVDELQAHWSYDLFTRKPAPAMIENGVLQPTDLDLACFMSALAQRGAVINIPHYEARRASTKTEGEHVVSKENRHGKVMSLSANESAFSFSVRIEDMNVIKQGMNGEADKVGAPRNFLLTDIDGSWWKGWDVIEFMPNAKENDFLNDKNLWTGNTVYFKNFVHPLRWTSFYGQYYFITKAIIQRLTEEASWCRKEASRLWDQGIRPPESERKEQPKSERGESIPKTITAFEAEVDVPFTGDFSPFIPDLDNWKEAKDRAKGLSYSTIPQLRFAVRATELAYYQAGMKAKGFPSWIKGATWEEGYVQKGKKTKWNRLVLTQRHVGQTGYAIRYRTWDKTERVSAE